MQRVRTIFSGFPGGDGVCTMYCNDAAALLPLLRNTMWGNLKVYIPEDVHIVTEPFGDIVEATNGQVTGTWTAAATTAVDGLSSGSYAAPAGASINWLTGTVADGTKIRGRTFIVPLGGASYTTQGQLLEVNRTQIAVFAADFVTQAASNFMVWHRPLSAADAALRKRPTSAHAGLFAFVTGSSVPNKVSILRSRRD